MPTPSLTFSIAGLLLLLGGPVVADDAAPPPDRVWPSFRGAFARGVGTGTPPPVTWDLETGANVKWRAPVPGLSYSSPIVWGDRVFVTTAVRLDGDPVVKVGLYGSPVSAPEEGPHRFQVYCLDATSGEVIWARTAVECVPDTRRHPKGSFAASTPATDGRHVVAFFGSEGLFVYTMDGDLVWSRDFGVLDAGWYVAPDAQFGYAGSPAIHDRRVFVQCDVQGGAFLAALDLATGDQLWRVARDEVPTWSTPTVDAERGRTQLLVNGYRHMGGYDLATGAELWKMSGGGDVPVPTPIVAFDRVYLTNGHGRWNPVYCVDARAEGEIADGFDADGEPHVHWSQTHQGTYMQTPIVVGDLLFLSNDAGVVSCHDALTGERLGRRRLGDGGDGFTASPVAAYARLYFTSESGEVHVIAADEEMEPLAVNSMNEIALATPAIADGTLFVRTRHHLVALADGERSAPIDAVAAAAADVVDPEQGQEPEDAGAVEWLESGDLPVADALVTAHIAARGGEERLRTVASVSVRSEWELVGIGMKGEALAQHRTPDRLLMTTTIPGMGDAVQGFDGEVAWLVHPAVGELILEGELRAEGERLARFIPELSFFDEFPERKTVGRCRFEGTVCFAVEAGTADGRRAVYYFEEESGLLAGRDTKMATLGGLSRVIEAHRAYREFDGVMVATEVVTRFPDDAMEQRVRVTDVSFEEVPLEVFALPEEIRLQLDDD